MTSNDSPTIGDIATSSSHDAWRTLAFVASVIVYIGMVGYTALHNWSLLTRGLASDKALLAAVGIVGLEINAVALPLALHFWFYSPLQRTVGLAFYGLDIALVIFNVIVDYATVTAEALPAWLVAYLLYVVPATPIIAAVGWSFLWLLDPGQRERAMIETMKAATREKLADKILESARDADLNSFAESVAQTMASDIVRATLGSAMRMTSPTNTVDRTWSAPPEPVITGGNGNGKHVYNAEAEDISIPKA
jgi:hypothetical protein